MAKREYLYLTFNSTTDAMAAESLFKESNIKGRLVIIPRELSAGCGMAWRSDPAYRTELIQVAKQNNITLNQVEIL
ncbi:DUF3343 domain-containing protein [Facklamia miroungae]|uniref:Putative Se/S carrier protein-like domain-containing protein n=1 Tax=Facklamia miroungae TaxID=120956 RepID=A0A1G7QU07_9LACT|nr:DUF3343 domain-containing protein [Facklamia miroungae]NKZ29039.1 DUF3343 domain-containing protein [Facklamia miroungae]SDG01150.1 Protein of unknown function [Facklamia miroungae]